MGVGQNVTAQKTDWTFGDNLTDAFSVSGRQRGEDSALKRRVTELADPLHYGTFGGTPTRVLWVVMGSLAFSLTLSGLMIAAHRFSPAPPARSIRAAVRAIYLPARFLLAPIFPGVFGILLFILFLQGT